MVEVLTYIGAAVNLIFIEMQAKWDSDADNIKKESERLVLLHVT